MKDTTSRQNETEAEDRLSNTQHVALAALLAGDTATAAATAAGVHRSTVHRWLTDPYFLAEINTRRADMMNALEEQLAQVQERAVRVVADAVESGDVRTALTVLKGSGLLDGQKRAVGLTEAEAIIEYRTHQESHRSILDSVARPWSRLPLPD